MRSLTLFLIFSLLITSVFALTEEASFLATPEVRSTNFWTEADITFWQTLPFATLWSYFAERQLSNFMFPGAAPHWDAVIFIATVVSGGNAFFHSQRVLKEYPLTSSENKVK